MIHETASVDPRADLHPTALVWAGTAVREGAVVGAGTSIGQYAYVGPGVRIGADCKIQNAALIYEPAVVEDAVFIGPRAVFTNDRFPRAVTPDGRPKTGADWEPVGVTVRHGASIGAGAVCVAPLEIGAWSTVAAGAVVTRDVVPHAIVAGVPARRVGWVGRSGHPLAFDGTAWVCPATGERYGELPGDAGLQLLAEPTSDIS